MASKRRLLAAACMLATLAGCGTSVDSSFDTRGLRAPEGRCDVKPSRLGLAERLRDIDEGNGCEVRNAWSVRALGEVTFSEPATVNCGMVAPLDTWLKESVQPSARRAFGEDVVGIDVAASYSCRPRNGVSGAKMSEHGLGNAIDVAAFTLASGRKVTVADGWRGGAAERQFLHAVHEDACGPFHTVLGPASDADHRDHIHLDLQNRRSGSAYCR
jgi:hypothetical protein